MKNSFKLSLYIGYLQESEYEKVAEKIKGLYFKLIGLEKFLLKNQHLEQTQ